MLPGNTGITKINFNRIFFFFQIITPSATTRGVRAGAVNVVGALCRSIDKVGIDVTAGLSNSSWRASEEQSKWAAPLSKAIRRRVNTAADQYELVWRRNFELPPKKGKGKHTRPRSRKEEKRR
jgi:hypothetical protein